MIDCKDFFGILSKNGVRFFTGVPDSLLKNVCAYITDHTNERSHIIAANEGNAVALAAGHYLATGKAALVYMQNSGLGNAVNPLMSLADKRVYSIPMLLLIGWRGEPGVQDEPQHLSQGMVTPDMLEVMDIPFRILDGNSWESRVEETLRLSLREQKPCALLIRKNTFGPYALKNRAENNYSMTREEALEIVASTCRGIFVSTTGKLSRELFEYRKDRGESHNQDFMTVGSMGHCSSIALSIALEHPERKVFCLDGDGAVLMHTGVLSSIASLSPENFIHILFNNGVHESVGGQPSAGFSVDFPGIAGACGYKSVSSVDNAEDLERELKSLDTRYAPGFLEIRINSESRNDLGRPTSSPQENKKGFIHFLGHG